MRVESQILKLKESKQWLTDISIKLKTLSINTDFIESNRIINEFKGYLRKKIGLKNLEKEERKTQKRHLKGQTSEADSDRDNSNRNINAYSAAGDQNREMDALLTKERSWLSNNLMPMTRV